MKIYFNGNFIEERDCRISPFDRGFLFADGVYEVIRNTGKAYIGLEAHINRLINGLSFMQIELPETGRLKEISDELLEINELKNREALIYIQATRGISNPRKHFFPCDSNPTVLVNVTPLNLNKEEKDNGVKVIIAEDIRWGRCDIKTISLLPNVLAMQKAKEAEAAEAILVRDGEITEGSHTNFFGIKNNRIYTAPLTKNILPGVTRKFTIELCRKFGMEIREECIKQEEINQYDEFFLTSTTLDITPVTQIGDLNINDAYPGVMTKMLQKEFSVFLKL